MRKNRVIEQNRCYHLVSRLAHRAFFLDDEEKDRAVALMRRVEAGVKASMSYCINRTVSISSFDLTDDFRLALAGRGWPKAAANLPTSWQIIWKTRDAIAAHPADAAKLLAERAAALKVFIDKDWPRLEKTFVPDFVKRMHMWIEHHDDT